MTVLTRAEWGARSPKQAPTRVDLSRRTGTAVHHDGDTPIIVRTLDEVKALVRRDQNFHMDGRGWNDIGYNFLVISAPGYPAIDGLIVEGRGRDIVGAHCEGHNTEWIGIQIAVGGGQVPTEAAKKSVRQLHDSAAAAKGGVLAKKVHLDGFATACPGSVITAWVRAGMPVAGPVASALPTVLTNPVKTVQKVVAKVTGAALVVDGDFGAKTITQWQRVMGTPVDGRLSIPSSLVRAVQIRLGFKGADVDGRLGPNTWKAIQRRIGVYPDGRPGPITIKALQRRLNAGQF